MRRQQLTIDFHTAQAYRGVRRLLVCGSRTLRASQRVLVEEELAAVPQSAVVVHGGARGADAIAGEVALARGLKVEVYPVADWEGLGLQSGVDFVVAFWDGRSRGTLDTLTKARARGLPVRVVEFLLTF